MSEREITNEEIEALVDKISDCIDCEAGVGLAVIALGALIASLLYDASEDDPELAQKLGSLVARITLNAAAGECNE